jgi:hypothetical protein
VPERDENIGRFEIAVNASRLVHGMDAGAELLNRSQHASRVGLLEAYPIAKGLLHGPGQVLVEGQPRHVLNGEKPQGTFRD